MCRWWLLDNPAPGHAKRWGDWRVDRSRAGDALGQHHASCGGPVGSTLAMPGHALRSRHHACGHELDPLVACNRQDSSSAPQGSLPRLPHPGCCRTRCANIDAISRLTVQAIAGGDVRNGTKVIRAGCWGAGHGTFRYDHALPLRAILQGKSYTGVRLSPVSPGKPSASRVTAMVCAEVRGRSHWRHPPSGDAHRLRDAPRRPATRRCHGASWRQTAGRAARFRHPPQPA